MSAFEVMKSVLLDGLTAREDRIGVTGATLKRYAKQLLDEGLNVIEVSEPDEPLAYRLDE